MGVKDEKELEGTFQVKGISLQSPEAGNRMGFQRNWETSVTETEKERRKRQEMNLRKVRGHTE